jgi:mono/diheme cytochrome c family protein
MLRTTLFGAAAVLSLAASACQTAVAERALIDDGHVIAQEQCASCHAIGLSDQSPRADAPPLRDVSQRYMFPVLEEELINGIKLGHPDMPKFQFSPGGADALLAYLRHIQKSERDREP